MTKQAQLFLDSNRGVYIPQHFAEMIDPADWRGIVADDIAALKAGPESDDYWHAWHIVLDNAETLDGGKLYQDGDLWLIWPGEAQGYIDSIVEYEESHPDAGDGYSHLPAESWTSDDTAELIRKLIERGVDLCGVDHDRIADLALDHFKMQPGHGFSIRDTDSQICIACYPIQEIEIQTEFDDVTLEAIGACHRGNLVYVATDVSWDAMVDVAALAADIKMESLQ